MHSSEFPSRLTELLTTVKPCVSDSEQHSQGLDTGSQDEGSRTENNEGDETVVVIGGGKSAQE